MNADFQFVYKEVVKRTVYHDFRVALFKQGEQFLYGERFFPLEDVSEYGKSEWAVHILSSFGGQS
jgi:hypothetical protein